MLGFDVCWQADKHEVFVMLYMEYGMLCITHTGVCFPYKHTSAHMRYCPHWGIYYTNLPDMEETSRPLLQWEFDRYTFEEAKRGVKTKCCNGLVWRMLLYGLGYAASGKGWHIVRLEFDDARSDQSDKSDSAESHNANRKGKMNIVETICAKRPSNANVVQKKCHRHLRF